jgi:hypothetical protein
MRALALTLALCLPLPAAAQEVIGSYAAYIGQDDLYNSEGQRLREPWQILRQDRANFHRFGIAQLGDEWDPFFGDVDNRAAMEAMLRSGTITSLARRDIVGGDVTVYVTIYGRGGRGTYIEVDVVG